VTTVTATGRREQLLEAADRVVRRDGSAATMNLIAAEAGITKPILYRHFGDKGGLYRALAERYIDELLGRLRAALATRGGLRARTRATIDAYLASVEE
jgi:AcrR family transcriptional regulator